MHSIILNSNLPAEVKVQVLQQMEESKNLQVINARYCSLLLDILSGGTEYRFAADVFQKWLPHLQQNTMQIGMERVAEGFRMFLIDSRTDIPATPEPTKPSLVIAPDEDQNQDQDGN